MQHELHGKWQTFLLIESDEPLELRANGFLDLKMTHAETGEVEAGSTHIPGPGSPPSSSTPTRITGKATPANGGYNVTLQETLADGRGRTYEGFLIGRSNGKLRIGGLRTLTSGSLLVEDDPWADERARSQDYEPEVDPLRADGQEEAIWVATKP